MTHLAPLSPLPPEPQPLSPEERARALYRLREMMRDALAFDAALQERFAYFAQVGRWPDDAERERIRASIAYTGGRL